MKRTISYLMYFAIIALTACSKKDSKDANVLTIESLSGTYGLKALIWESGGNTINVYDELEACEKDNLVQLNSDKTLNFIDAGLCVRRRTMAIAHGI